MKNIVYIVILIPIVIACFSSCARLFGGMSKEKAAKTLTQYLGKHTDQKLGFSNLNRFWNEGNMNPNMFTVEIFDEQIPEIRFGLHFDAKVMKEQDSLSQGSFQELSIQEQYEEFEKDYRIKQSMIVPLKKDGIQLDFNYYSATLQFENKPKPKTLKATISTLMKTMNSNKSHLLSSNYFNFNIQTPQYSSAVLQANTASETEKEDWKLNYFTLNSKAEDYKVIEQTIEAKTTQYLNQLDHKYQMHTASKVFVNTDTFEDAVWIQFLSDKSETDDTIIKRSRAPITAVVFQFFDLETQAIIRTELKPISNVDSFDAYWENIKNKLPFPTSFKI
ncbi:hypothetical protein [Mesonia aestuariivivens]|uniref:Lipoprotein n=1 Tax=Mesonia aestuariivivens TaxID=2796128 RepID=A0ABS6VYA0_9FLAO|nr:hypothetical protein [Mesonia aestuariivivens]MBW2960565.1 hypothetical protein [Mesonia aestuariivivens]